MNKRKKELYKSKKRIKEKRMSKKKPLKKENVSGKRRKIVK